MREVLDAWRPVIDEEIERLLPRLVDDAYLSAAFGPPTYEYDADALQQALAKPIWALLDRGGKRWRAVVCLQLVEGFGADPDAYLPYAVVPEILHNGTIIVDDVEDRAELRRGEPALHHEFGVDIALNAGNAMYFLPLKIIAENPADLGAETQLRAWEMLTDELNRTHLGQGIDIHWHNQQAIEVSEPEYLEMCACKTGCLGRIVARLAAIVTEQPDAVERQVAGYAERMSIAFQIGDDILDVEHTLDRAGEFGKAYGNDIREGKKTLMVIHAAQNADPADVARLEEILWAEENTDADVLAAIEILQSTGSVEYARERARDLAAEARDHLDGVELQPEVEENLTEFTRFVIDRDV
jgi:geranylgeranyl diphosphate synthase type I